MDDSITIDLLLSRYGTVDYIMTLPWECGVEQIRTAAEKDSESRVWEMWLTLYPRMDKKTFVPFSRFLKDSTCPSQPISQKPKDELLKEADAIRRQIESR